jgi:2'-5' RNA ligase
MSTLIRSFIAIPLPPQILTNLVAFTRQQGLHARESGFKPVKAENMHLSLKFLGEIDQNQVREVSQALTQITASLDPFRAAVRGIGAFPNWSNRVRVIWVGVEPVEPIRSVYRLIDEATVKIGVPSEDRAFSPHLTLARISFMTRESELAFKRLKSISPEPEFGEFMADKVVFYRSTLLPQGPVYNLISSHPFSAG